MQRQTTGDNRAEPTRPWTSREITRLRELAQMGAPIVAQVLNRTERSVRIKASKLRVSLRVPGNRHGIILGQPRGASWEDPDLPDDLRRTVIALRSSILDGTTHAATLEQLATTADREPLCPGCSAFPIRVPATGLCYRCHYARLARAHDEQQSAQQGQRSLWQERQRKSRQRRAANTTGGTTDG